MTIKLKKRKVVRKKIMTVPKAMPLSTDIIKQKIINMVKDNNKEGITTKDIRRLISKNTGASFSYYQIRYILEGMQSDCIIQELFDDEVTLEDRWYLHS